VRRDHGESAATEVARRLVVAPHRAGGQAQYLHRPMPPKGTAGIAQTCDWAVGRLEQPLTVADLAREAGWAPRTFARRFQAETGTTPLRWLTARRLAEARRLLETTDIPVEAVAQRAGLGTAANLRALFTKDMATSPSAYRSAYRGRGFVSGRRGQPAVTP